VNGQTSLLAEALQLAHRHRVDAPPDILRFVPKLSTYAGFTPNYDASSSSMGFQALHGRALNR